MIVIAEINKLHNLSQNQLRNGKIAREVGKLHSLWFKSTSKEVRLAGLRDNL